MNTKRLKKEQNLFTAIIIIAVILIIAVTILIVVNSTKTITIDETKDTIRVEYYVGKMKSDVNTPNLSFEYVEVYSEQAPGVVVAQSVAADSEVEKGTVITLNVSRGSSAVQMPAVVNLPCGEAKKILEDNGFVVEIQYVINESGENQGIVFETSPENSMAVAYGSTVTIKVYGDNGGPSNYVTNPTTSGSGDSSSKTSKSSSKTSGSSKKTSSTDSSNPTSDSSNTTENTNPTSSKTTDPTSNSTHNTQPTSEKPTVPTAAEQ